MKTVSGYNGTSHGIDRVKDMSGVLGFHSSKPFTEAPAIVKEYTDTDGVRMYECKGDRHFIASTYDATFLPVKTAIRPHNFKGENAFYKGQSSGGR